MLENLEVQVYRISIIIMYMDTLFLNEQRCACGKLLLKGIFFDGTLEIKCKHCGTINKIGSIKLADDSNHYLLIINEKGSIINASSSSCKILGYSHEELIGKHFTEINPSLPKDLMERFFGVESILNEDNHFQFDTINRTKGGVDISVTVFFRLYKPTSNEKHILLSVEVKDFINDHKKTSEKSDLNFSDNACNFYFDIDKIGNIEYASPLVKKFLGFSQEAIVGKNYFDLILNEDREESKKIFKHFSTKEQPYRVVHSIKKDVNNNTIDDEIYFTPNYNDKGIFIGYRLLVWVK